MNMYATCRRLAGSVTVACLALACITCGGSGGSGGSGGTGSTSDSANPYAGTYSGQFEDQTSFIGPFTMTVSSSGAISGTYGYATPLNFTGSVNSSGSGSLTDSNGTFQVTLGSSGLPTLGGGIGTPSNGAFVALASNPTGQFNGLSGDYAGTVHNTTVGLTGIIAFNVGSSGALTGLDLFVVNGSPTLVSISGTLSSSGALSYSIGSLTVTGTVSLSGTTLSGALTESDGDSATLSVQQVQPVG